jgi:gluconokinase
MIIIVMGVSGAGKSTFGSALASELGYSFVEGDDYHPPAKIAKMSAGIALDDADREPWLAALARDIAGWQAAGRGVVLACSALKRRYRERLLADCDPTARGVRFVHLYGTPRQIGERLAARRGHYMPSALLDSQFAALEMPDAGEPVLDIDVDRPLAEALAAVREWLRNGSRNSPRNGSGTPPA